MKKAILYIATLAFLMLLPGSCQVDEPPVIPEDLSPKLTLTIKMPRTAIGSRAGLTKPEENIINDLTILVFRDIAGVETCIRTLPVTSFTPIPGTDDAEYTITIPVPLGTYNLMFIANTATLLTALNPAWMTRADIEQQLLYTMTAKWDVNAHPGFPMWGILNNISVTGDYTYPTPLPMLRMLARINVTVDDLLANDFNISSIRLRNPGSKGRVIPHETNLDTSTPGEMKPTAPSLPLNSQNNPDPVMLPTPFVYTSAEIANGISCINQIYALESLDPDEYCWLELTATYGSDPEISYRIDFARTENDGTQTPMPLLRNHTYDIRIQSVSADFELGVLVDSWDESTIPVNEEFYSLKILNATYTLENQAWGGNAKENKITILTDHPAGWQLTISYEQGSGWLTVRRANGTAVTSGTANVREEFYLDIPANTTGSPRSAWIIVRAGRIEGRVRVTQQS